jgi:hypothetical protein
MMENSCGRSWLRTFPISGLHFQVILKFTGGGGGVGLEFEEGLLQLKKTIHTSK